MSDELDWLLRNREAMTARSEAAKLLRNDKRNERKATAANDTGDEARKRKSRRERVAAA